MRSARGDDAANEEKLAWANGLAEGNNNTKIAGFYMDFHAAADNKPGFDADKDYTGYEWWLARTEDGWEIISGEK